MTKKEREMQRFDEWAARNLHGIYKPAVKTRNGLGYENEYLNACWESWQAAEAVMAEINKEQEESK